MKRFLYLTHKIFRVQSNTPTTTQKLSSGSCGNANGPASDRPVKLLKSSVLLGLVICLLVSLILPLLSARLGGLAQASPVGGGNSEGYVIAYPGGGKAALDTCLLAGNCSQSDLQSMVVFAKDGVFGSTAIQMKYEPRAFTTLPDFAVTGNYSCQNFSISALVVLHNLNNLEGSTYQAQIFLDNVRNTTTHKDTTAASNGRDSWLSAAQLGAPGSTGGSVGPAGKLPAQCFPTNVNTGQSNIPITVGNYGSLSSSAQSSWGSSASSLFGSASNNGVGGGSTPATKPTCDAGTFSLNWILCPIYNGISSASDWMLNNIIQPELQTEPICLDASGASCSDKKNITYQVWSNFRLYGDVFLVIALLVIVFGESIGGGLIDAYTIKKVLPRLLAAAILINLSIYIVAFLVDITNVIGGGIGQIITAPLASKGAFTIQPSGIAQGTIAGGALIAGAVGAAPLAALISIEGGTLILIGLVLPAALAILAVFVTITLRKAIILALILVSPVAFALYCLPNTEKYFRKWWNTLFEMLIIYPLIILIFSIADILSVITGNINSSNPLNAIISFMLLIIPLFLIPYAFRLAGGTLSRLHDGVSAGRQKLHGMTQTKRDRAKQQFGRRVTSKRSQMYDSERAQALNRRLGSSTLGRRSGLSYLMGRRMEAVDQERRRLAEEMSRDPNATAVKNDDNTLRAKTQRSYKDAVSAVEKHLQVSQPTMSAEDRTREAQRAARAAQVSGGFGASQATWALEQMAQTGTALRDNQDQAELIAQASGGNVSTMASLAGNLNAVNKQVGRHDLAPNFANLWQLAQQENAKQRGQGTGPSAGDYGVAAENAWQSASLYQHANDKPQNIQAAIKHFSSRLNHADEGEREKAAVFFNELKAMSPNATGAVKVHIDEALESNAAALGASVGALPATPVSPETEKGVYEERQVRDAATGDYVKQTQQVGTRAESAKERIERRSRTYERVDPNNL